jgi:hypothetical protein
MNLENKKDEFISVFKVLIFSVLKDSFCDFQNQKTQIPNNIKTFLQH